MFHNSNRAPSDSAMAVPGYKFLGWITTAEVEKDSGVWNYIYDVNGDSFTTSDPAKAAPYLVTGDYVCTQPQDAYPVYAKYNVNYDTNLHRAGFTGTDTVNAPNWQITPTLTETDGVSTASVEPDITTTVYKNGTEKYVLEKVELECPDGTIQHFYGSGGGVNTYAAIVEAGGSYTFVAYYAPLAVVYHLNATDIDGKVAQRGDTLGSLDGGIPKPTFNVGDIDAADGNAFHAFVGWTADKPDGNAKYVIWSQATDMVDKSTVVNAPMELFPVYRVTTVVVNSNIDSVLDDPSSVRGLTRTASGDQTSLQVKAAAEVQGNNGKTYDFVGWSRDYNAEDGSYTLMTSEKDYALEGSEPFATGVTYTAVYKETPWKVRYHGADGDVLYEARLTRAAPVRQRDSCTRLRCPPWMKTASPCTTPTATKRLRLRAWLTIRMLTLTWRKNLRRVLPTMAETIRKCSLSGAGLRLTARWKRGISSTISPSRATWTCIPRRFTWLLTTPRTALLWMPRTT